MAKLGIICGLEAEASIARRIPDAQVAVAAARPEQALRLAREMAGQGIKRLLSFGLAAGLAPELPIGGWVVATHVLTTDTAWQADEAWFKQLIKRLPTAYRGPMWGSPELITTPAEKQAIYQTTHCLALDMESQAVAQAAAENRLPFAVVRAVSDTAAMGVPPAASVPLKPDGTIDGVGVMGSILRHPRQMPELIRLGKGARIAMSALETIAQIF